MKKLLPVLAIFSWALASCVDDPLAHDNMPVVTLAEPADLKRTSVILEADLDGPDIGSVTEIGFILGENSSLNDNVVKVSVEEVAKGRFSALVKDLQIGHTYFYAAYATNGRQTVKSQVEALTTLTRSSALLGDIEVYEVGDETFLRSSIEDDGGATINMAGFCFDTNENPTIYKGNIQAKLEEDGSFTANVTEYLDEGKTYYLRAFVDNDILGDGTTSISYGLQTVYAVPKIEKVNIPDAVFKAYIVENFDKNGDKEISLKEAAAITEINVNTNDIATLKGVECFENMEILRVRGNHFEDKGQLKELDLRANKRLTYISCTYNILESLYLPENNIIEHIDLFQNSLKYINTLDCPELTYLDLSYSYLTEVDLCGCPKLVELHYHCNLDDVRGKVDISGLINLKKLYLENAECPETLNEVNDLEVLHLINAGLQSFDFSMFPNLINFNCSDNELAELDLSHALNLKELGVRNIGISNIDVSELQNLESLECGSNELTELNISNNFKLTSLGCTYNKLSRLDISNNKSLDFLSCLGNQDLYTIYVWNGFSESDITQLYKPSYTRYVIKGQGYGGPSILSDIPDENFRAYVLENFDYDGNGDVTTEEALKVESISVNTDVIVSMEGIGVFRNLLNLRACGNSSQDPGMLTELDLRENTELTHLECFYNNIEKLYLPDDNKIQQIDARVNKLSYINTLVFPELTFISLYGSYLTEVDFSQCPKLVDLTYACNPYDIRGKTNINGLENLKRLQLFNVECPEGIKDLSGLENLALLDAGLHSFDLSNFPNLIEFSCTNNELTELDLACVPHLKSLDFQNNKLASVDLSCLPDLETLWCGDNVLSILDLTVNTRLKYLGCGNNRLSSLDISNAPDLYNLYCKGNLDLQVIYVWEGFNESDHPYFSKDASTRYVVKGQGYGGTSILSEIPDENFRAYVLENFDYDANGDVTTEEALLVESIDLNTDNIYSLEGIRYFENLGSLVARGTEYYEDWKYRGQLTELDLSYNQKLYNIWCGFNHIKYIKFHPDAIIENLNIGYNQELTGFSEFDMSQLRHVALRETMVTDLDLRGAVNLYSIEYSYFPDPEIKRSLNIDGLTKITRMELRHLDGNLDVSNLSNLEYLCADYCNLKELDLRNRSKLKELIVDGNQLTAIDLNGCIMLESLSVRYNLLGELDLQDNMKLTYMNSYGNPDLRTIYVWDGFNEADYPDFYKDETATYVVKQ